MSSRAVATEVATGGPLQRCIGSPVGGFEGSGVWWLGRSMVRARHPVLWAVRSLVAPGRSVLWQPGRATRSTLLLGRRADRGQDEVKPGRESGRQE